MKFIGFFEYNKEDTQNVIERRMKLRALREKEPDKFAKLLTEDYGMAGDLPKLTKDYTGFALYEADNVDQLVSMMLLLGTTPSYNIKFIPIMEGGKSIELFQKMKQLL